MRESSTKPDGLVSLAVQLFGSLNALRLLLESWVVTINTCPNGDTYYALNLEPYWLLGLFEIGHNSRIDHWAVP